MTTKAQVSKDERLLVAVGYSRISDDDNGDAKGVRRQRREIEAMAAQRGWHLLDVLEDNDKGASTHSRKQRPDFERLMGLAKSGTVDVVCAYNLDRLTRRPTELEALIELASSGLSIVTLQGDINLATEDGRAMARVLMAMAAKESDAISRRVRSKQAEARNEGRKHHGSRRLFGYTLAMEVVETEAVVLREMVRRVGAGASCSSVAKWLNEQGCVTSMGGRWHGRTVGTLVSNPAIAGMVGYYGEAVGRGRWTPIVSEDEWALAVRSVEAAKVPGLKRTGRPTPWSGLIRCECGASMVRANAMTVHKGVGKVSYTTWKCRKDRGGCGGNSITAGVEDYVAGFLAEAAHRARVQRRTTSAPEVRSSEDVRRSIARLQDVAEDLLEEDYRQRLEALRGELKRARAAEARPTAAERVIDHGETLAEVWSALDEEVQREIAHTLVQSVTIAKGSRQRWSEAVAEKRCSIAWRI